MSEFLFNPENKIPCLKYLYDEGFIGYNWEKKNNKDIIEAFDRTNLSVDIKMIKKELIFSLLQEELKIKIIKTK